MLKLEKKLITLDHDGTNLNIAVLIAQRSKKWIVGLHGIQSDKSMYEGLFSQPFAEDYSLLAIDFVGFGDSDKPLDFSYDVADQIAVVQQLLDVLDIDRLHMVGHSLGGMVGTLLLRQLGDRLLSFANLEGNLVRKDCGASQKVVRFSLEEFERTGYDHLRAQIAQSSEPSAAARIRWLEQVSAQIFYKTSLSIIEWSRSGKLRDAFNDSNARRMFMYGSENAYKADGLADTIQRTEIPDAGHFMLLDQSDACYKILRKFITKK